MPKNKQKNEGKKVGNSPLLPSLSLAQMQTQTEAK